MDVALIKSFYNPISKVKVPERSICADTGCEIEWIPILPSGKQGNYMGITQKGLWCVGTAQNLRILDHPKWYLHCIALMENPFDEVVALLRGLFGADIDVYNIFPFVEIIDFSFHYDASSYWIQLAVEWIDQVEPEKRQTFLNGLKKTINNKDVSQKSRHKARKITRQILS